MTASGPGTGWVRCPGTIRGKRWVAMWRAGQQQLRRQGTWRSTDAHDLEQLVLARQAATHARARVSKDGPVVTGSQGQPVTHPGLKIAEAQERLAVTLAETLQLTAAARERNGLDRGDDQPTAADQFGDLTAFVMPNVTPIAHGRRGA